MDPLTNSNIHKYVELYFRREQLPPINTWDVSRVTDMSKLFKNELMKILVVGMSQV